LISTQQDTLDFRAFEATPGISVIVLPDAPVYTLVAVSNDFTNASGMKREDVIGKGHFTVFPKSPDDPAFTGELNLKASFEFIIKHKQPHSIPLQRYDIPAADGHFLEKYWQVTNAPILNDEGELLYIIHSATDVTDLVKREQQGRKTIQFLIDNSPIGIVIYEAIRNETGRVIDFRIKNFNKKVNELTGFSAEERATFTFLQIMQTLGTLHVFNQFVAVVEEGKSIVREQYIQRTEKWISFSGAKFEDGFLATLTDITELKKSQESLQREVQFSKGILNASLNGIYVLEAVRDNSNKVVDFILLEGNQKFSELTGWLVDEVLGKSFLTSFPVVKENGFFDLLCQVIESGEPHRQATYYAETFGRWYDYIAVRLGENSVVVTFQEVTQIKEAAVRLEQQKSLLDSILKHSPGGIAVYTAVRDSKDEVVDFQCILANDAAELFTQVPNNLRLTKTVSEITPGIKDTPLFQMAVAAVETGQPFQTQYFHEEIGKWLELSVVKMYEDHLINLFRDITSIKETELRLQKSINDLKMYNTELEQFAYITSHDLQEPLRKIRIFNTMAYEQLQDDSSIKKQLQKVDESARRMSDIITSLLDYSRIGSGNLHFQKINLNKIIQDILIDFELLITEKGAIIETAEMPEIEAHALQMNQLFFNLIGNALKFSKKNIPPVITIRAQRLSDERKASFEQLQKEKEYIEITVQDNGIGFNPEYAKKIFTVFQRLNDRSLYGGYGIGLAICKKTVDSHNGIIYAEGQPKVGAKFTVILPYKQK